MDARLTFEKHETSVPPFLVRDPAPTVRQQLLPFTIRVVTTTEQLYKAVDIRRRAYGRHVPVLGEQLRQPEPLDLASGCIVLLAESKLDGEPVGTMRIQVNRGQRLALEEAVDLPGWMQDGRLAQISRLGIEQGRVGAAVKVALFKAAVLHCEQQGIRWMLIAGRAPLDRMYESLYFEDLYPGELVPMPQINNALHRIMALDLPSLRARAAMPRHPLFEYFFETVHPDIDLNAAQPAIAGAVRNEEPLREVSAVELAA